MDTGVPKRRLNDWLFKYKYPILVVLVGLGLMLLPSGVREEPEAPPPETTIGDSLEARLELLLSEIQGAGRVRVLLTEESGRETLYQTDSTSESDGASGRRTDDTVLVEDGTRAETGLIRQTLEPTYRGAVVLCQGADQAAVRLAIVEAVRCVTGLRTDQISVQKMK